MPSTKNSKTLKEGRSFSGSQKLETKQRRTRMKVLRSMMLQGRSYFTLIEWKNIRILQGCSWTPKVHMLICQLYTGSDWKTKEWSSKQWLHGFERLRVGCSNPILVPERQWDSWCLIQPQNSNGEPAEGTVFGFCWPRMILLYNPELSRVVLFAKEELAGDVHSHCARRTDKAKQHLAVGNSYIIFLSLGLDADGSAPSPFLFIVGRDNWSYIKKHHDTYCIRMTVNCGEVMSWGMLFSGTT